MSRLEGRLVLSESYPFFAVYSWVEGSVRGPGLLLPCHDRSALFGATESGGRVVLEKPGASVCMPMRIARVDTQRSGETRPVLRRCWTERKYGATPVSGTVPPARYAVVTLPRFRSLGHERASIKNSADPGRVDDGTASGVGSSGGCGKLALDGVHHRGEIEPVEHDLTAPAP